MYLFMRIYGFELVWCKFKLYHEIMKMINIYEFRNFTSTAQGARRTEGSTYF